DRARVCDCHGGPSATRTKDLGAGPTARRDSRALAHRTSTPRRCADTDPARGRTGGTSRRCSYAPYADCVTGNIGTRARPTSAQGDAIVAGTVHIGGQLAP